MIITGSTFKVYIILSKYMLEYRFRYPRITVLFYKVGEYLAPGISIVQQTTGRDRIPQLAVKSMAVK